MALASDRGELRFDGLISPLRPPTLKDAARFGQRNSRWISQPTGMDIRADGLQLALITYRSLYLYNRAPGKTWVEVLAREPREYIGPDSRV